MSPEPTRQELQALGIHPAPCARFCEATAFRIEARQLEARLKPLHATGGTSTAELLDTLKLGRAFNAGQLATLHDLLLNMQTERMGGTYITKPAESLMGIALRQLGNEARWREILDLNADQLSSSMSPHEYPRVGTVLKLPPKITKQP